MIVHVPSLLLCLILILLPRQVLRLGGSIVSGSRRRRHFTNPRDRREPGDHALRAGEEFRKPRNYIDFFRAAAGSLCLFGGVIDAALSGEPGSPAPLIRDAILILAVLVQTVRFEERLSLYAPVFFIAGLNAGAVGILPAVVGFALTWVLNPLLPNPVSFLAVLGTCTAGFYLAFQRHLDGAALMPVLLAALPILISAIVRRPLTGLRRRIQT